MNSNSVKALSITDLNAMKQRGEKISCLTAYDASFSQLIDAAGIDVMLVGDSLGMTIQGHKTTLPVRMADMVYHSRCVTRRRKRAFVIADLPFMSYPSPRLAAKNAAQLVQCAQVQMVKLEGARVDIVRFLVQQGIAVCGHLGLLPQHINQLGGYKIQGIDANASARISDEAQQLQDAGASLLILECVPAELGKTISANLSIPVIGIGAGVDCDGQILVVYDMLNISAGKLPRFCKDFLAQQGNIQAALSAYHHAVKHAEFPCHAHSF